MAAAGNKKKFGLILASARREQAARSVAGAGGVRRLNPLRDSDEELEAGEEEEAQQQEDTMDWVQAALKKSGGGNSAQLAQQQRLMREALEEDASVFQYDELYDDMQAGRDTAKQEKKQAEKKPKFIHNILKSAERRKLEKEQRTERKVQREREEEKGLYDDKESFVTPAYLAKLEELKQAEARERMEALVEEKNDAARNKNVGLFYQHIYKQRMGETSAPAVVKSEPPEGEAQENEEAPNTDKNPAPTSTVDSTNNSDTHNEDITIRRRDQRSRANKYRAQRDIDDSPTREDASPPQSKKKRQKSGRPESGDSSDSEQERRRTGKRKAPSQSVSPDRNSKSQSLVKKKSSSDGKSTILKNSSSSPNSKNTSSIKEDGETKIKDEPESSSDEEDESEDTKKKARESKEPENKPVESKESRDERIKKLFTKRCVGEKFIEAQQRYFQRRAERESSGEKGL